MAELGEGDRRFDVVITRRPGGDQSRVDDSATRRRTRPTTATGGDRPTGVDATPMHRRRRPQPALHVRDVRQGRLQPVRRWRPRSRVAETPARSYNPLFIYGSAGLGKTHLLHAIGHYVHHNYQHHVVRYVSTETFMNEYVDAIRSNSMAGLRRKLPRDRRAADRRRAVPRRQGRPPGGVLPHVQLAARRQQADRDLRPTACPTRSRRSRNACAAASSGA